MDQCYQVESTGEKFFFMSCVQFMPLCVQSSYAKAPTLDWKIDGSLAGQVRSGGGLTFAAVAGAGHMVPMDQPRSVSYHCGA